MKAIITFIIIVLIITAVFCWFTGTWEAWHWTSATKVWWTILVLVALFANAMWWDLNNKK